MSTVRCLVVGAHPSDVVATAARAALCAHPDVLCEWRCNDTAPQSSAEADVVVLCTGDVSCDNLRRWQACSENGALLVVAEGEAQMQACLDAGVADFVVTPLRPHELVARVRRAAGIERRNHSLPVPIAALPRIEGIVGHTPVFMKQLARLPMIAGCDAGVLIVGETGTGKEVFAQAIHYLSARASRPWVAVNCAAIPPDLLENELFGHARGAYTNAHSVRMGLVRDAEGGTLFLDEIDSLPYGAQAKLLRFLQDKEFRLIGSNVVHRADVRIVAATNHDLTELIARGAFRQDLYFRLNVLPLSLPPLRERRDDVAELAEYFAAGFAAQFHRRVDGFTPRAIRELTAYDWPGNVRELAHVVERAVLMGRSSRIDTDDLDLCIASEGDESFRSAKSRVVGQFERSYIERLLATHDGNVTHAAHAAKKNRRAFFELIRKHKIAAERFRPRS